MTGRIGVILAVIGVIAIIAIGLGGCSPIFVPGGSLVLEVFDD